ncbi:uncharacterized protein LOC121619810 [Tachysurus ichikawai]
MTATLRAKVEYMSGKLFKLESKCDDLESRSRRNNVRIVGVSEDILNNLSTEYVSKLLMEAFTLEKEPLVDRAHQTLAPKPGDPFVGQGMCFTRRLILESEG